jgi:hypothetical protein
MRTFQHGNDADRRLPVLLELPPLRRAAQTQDGGLLRVLQLWQRYLPSSAKRARMLRLTMP